MLIEEKTDPSPDHHDGPADSFAFPASVAQQAFWYLELLDRHVSAFNIPLRFSIDGPLDSRRLEAAIRSISSRHEILRTRFEEEQGKLLQIVSPESGFILANHDLSHLSREEQEQEADRLAREEASRPFELSKAPLFRAEIVRLSPEKHLLHLTFHHAIFDGLSIGVFTSELAAIYEAETVRPDHPLPPLPIQYGDYSVWQEEFIQSPAITGQLAWWKKTLSGMTEIEIPSDRPRPSVKSWKGDIVTTPLPPGLIPRLQAVATRHGASLFHIQLAAFKLLLQRYTGSDDISVGTPVSGRNSAGLEPLIGIFINSLVIRGDLSGNPAFGELLRQVRDHTLQAISHQDVPFENLVRELKPSRDPGRNPLFQIHFSHDRFAPKPMRFAGLTLSPLSSRSPGSIFDLHLFLSERESGWKAGCDFSTDLFDRSTAGRILGHYLHLLEQIAENPDRRIADFDVLTDSEIHRITETWSRGPNQEPVSTTLVERFREISASHPGRTALVHGSREISYGQLYRDAVSLAETLSSAGVTAGTFVGIYGDPDPRTIVGLLGILFAGGAYVPLHREDPEERVQRMISEAGLRFFLSSGKSPSHFTGTVVELPAPGSAHGGDLPPVAGLHPDSPAYLMFTSGSTGTPKGVVIPHRGIIRLAVDNEVLPFTKDDVFLLSAPLSFDASTLEIWSPLLNGGTLVIPAEGTGLHRIASDVKHHKVTVLWLTSGLFNLMIDEHAHHLTGLRYLLAGGDVLSVPHVRKAWKSLPHTTLVNGYGPTENTTFTTCHVIRKADLDRPAIPIGRPVSRTTVHLLDPNGRLVPEGVPGELHTGGAGLAAGYLRDDDLTARKFIDHPEFGRLYRTGDICRWTSGGTLEFIGRADQQVKIRGFRIEPGEIESTLLGHPAVLQAKVAVRTTASGEKQIGAWVTVTPGFSPDENEITGFLKSRLPAYLCPQSVTIIDAFPVTRNGKIDTAALPDPASAGPKPSSPPLGGLEEKLAVIWRELLELEVVQRDDDFFSLGGHSLMALRMFSRIHRDFGKNLPLSALISHPTIRELALLLDVEKKPSTQAGEKGNLIPLTPPNDLPPLFCVHGGDGGVLFYRNLASLMKDDVSIIAIESNDLGSNEPIIPCSIEETAASYTRSLLAAHPRGPYRLAGYSFGGVVAYEMARILSSAGHHVDFLALLDTHNPAAPFRVRTFPQRVSAFWRLHSHLPLLPRTFRLFLRFFEGIATHRRVKKEKAAARKQGPADAHDDLRHIQVREENWRAMQAYQPSPFPGKITLIKAGDPGDKIEWPADYGWQELAAGGFGSVTVPGTHFTIFEGENVRNLAAALSSSVPRPKR